LENELTNNKNEIIEKADWFLIHANDSEILSGKEAKTMLNNAAVLTNIKIHSTGKTQDTGFGLEEEFILTGTESDINSFLAKINVNY